MKTKNNKFSSIIEVEKKYLPKLNKQKIINNDYKTDFGIKNILNNILLENKK